MAEENLSIRFAGKTLSPGLGQGRTFVYRDDLQRFDEFYDIDKSAVEEEVQRFEVAAAEISRDLDNLAAQVEKEMDEGLSGIFHAHMAMVADPSLNAEVKKEIAQEHVSAGSATRTVFRRWERRFRAMEAEIASEKADDIHDLMRRFVSTLAGVHAHVLEDLPPGSVLIANRLLPSDTIFLARRSAAAAVLETGGAASHAAQFARETGLPCVSGIAGVVGLAPPGQLALVDADVGEVIVDPDQQQRQGFQTKCEQQAQATSKARARAHKPAVTKNATAVNVFANVGGLEDTQAAIANGADGIGLYRIERLYLGRHEPPDTHALLEELQKTLQPAKKLPVYVRLLDIGADKPLPFLAEQRERNPSLGCRGIRFLLQYPELLQTQMNALLQLSVDFDLHIVVPMVTLVNDMRAIRDCLRESAARCGHSPTPKLGAMIETPAAALAAREIARHADFFSFGTNDLTQYTFAADRENGAVDAYFDDAHDVIFRLLKTVHEQVPQVPLSICGELASRPDAALKILTCGIRTLSVAPPFIPWIKEAVRECDVG